MNWLPLAEVSHNNSGNAGDEEEEVDLTDGLLPLSGPGRVKFQLPEWPLSASPPLDGKLLRLKASRQ